MIKKYQIYIWAVVLISYSISYSQLPNTLSNTEKIYGLSKFWQEVNYNFVFLKDIDRNAWEKNYQDLIEKVQKTKNDYEYYRLLQKFCATLKDGHTNVYLPDNIKIQNTYFGDYRLFVTNIENKAIITRVNFSKKNEIPIGTEVIEVNGLKTQNYLEKNVKPYISSSTEHVLNDWAVSRMFRSPEGTSYDVTLRLPDGTTKELKLTHSDVIEEKVYPTFEESSLLGFEWLDDNIAYLALNSFGDDKIISLFNNKLPELYKADKLIIDLRNNGGGNTSIARPIFKNLTNDSLLYGSKSRSRMHIPAYKAWGKFRDKGDTLNSDFAKKAFLSYRDMYYYEFPYSPSSIEQDTKSIVIPTAILTGHSTASAAEDFLIFTENQEHMTIIGEPTFGSTGQPLFFDLPGGGSARICTKEDLYPNGKKFVGVGIQPDLLVNRTLSDFKNDRDAVLETAIEYLKGKR